MQPGEVVSGLQLEKPRLMLPGRLSQNNTHSAEFGGCYSSLNLCKLEKHSFSDLHLTVRRHPDLLLFLNEPHLSSYIKNFLRHEISGLGETLSPVRHTGNYVKCMQPISSVACCCFQIPSAYASLSCERPAWLNIRQMSFQLQCSCCFVWFFFLELLSLLLFIPTVCHYCRCSQPMAGFSDLYQPSNLSELFSLISPINLVGWGM